MWQWWHSYCVSSPWPVMVVTWHSLCVVAVACDGSAELVSYVVYIVVKTY
jgi:hypothetical protein